MTGRRRLYIVEKVRCPKCGYVTGWPLPRSFSVGGELGIGSGRTYMTGYSTTADINWETYPSFRCRCRLEYDLEQLTREHEELEAFARAAGLILENMSMSYSLTPEKPELLLLTERYHKLFPPVDDDLEF